MTAVHYDIHNPMPRHRIIYDGLVPPRDETKGPPTGGVVMPASIMIAPGDTLRNVALSEAIAARLLEDAANFPGKELVLTKSTAQPVMAKPKNP